MTTPQGVTRKIVAAAGGPWELYDMQADRTELNDLSAVYPDRVREMETLYQEWAARVGAKSWDLLDTSSR